MRGYVPTPSEIRYACELIQATWSEEERAKRAVGQSQRPVLPHGWQRAAVSTLSAKDVRRFREAG